MLPPEGPRASGIQAGLPRSFIVAAVPGLLLIRVATVRHLGSAQPHSTLVSAAGRAYRQSAKCRIRVCDPFRGRENVLFTTRLRRGKHERSYLGARGHTTSPAFSQVGNPYENAGELCALLSSSSSSCFAYPNRCPNSGHLPKSGGLWTDRGQPFPFDACSRGYRDLPCLSRMYFPSLYFCVLSKASSCTAAPRRHHRRRRRLLSVSPPQQPACAHVSTRAPGAI